MTGPTDSDSRRHQGNLGTPRPPAPRHHVQVFATAAAQRRLAWRMQQPRYGTKIPIRP